MADLRREMLAWKPLEAILALQKADGSFPCSEKKPTARPTLNALALMARCGMDGRDEPVARALAHVSSSWLRPGAFSYTGGGSGVLPCYVGLFARAVTTMAGLDAAAVQGSLQWIVDHQRFDHKDMRGGGPKRWPFKAVDSYGGCWWSVSCYHGVVPTLAALAAIPPAQRTPSVESRIDDALQYLRIHRVFRRTRDDKPLFRHLTRFFLTGGYRCHLIDVLESIADANATLIGQEWVRRTVETMEGFTVDGKVPLLKNYPSRLIDPLPFEPVGEPSRFLTYQWLLVKRKFGLPIP